MRPLRCDARSLRTLRRTALHTSHATHTLSQFTLALAAMQVADGAIKKSPQSKEPLPEGAVRIKWPADADRDEKESYTWTVLHPANWRKEANFGWRFAASELAKRKKPASPEKRPRQQ